MSSHFFTSESVCSGHPDKICDQISDAVLDAALAVDPESRVAVETLVTVNQVVLAGEVRSNAQLNFEQIVKQQLQRLGYTDQIFQFGDYSPVTTLVHQQSSEIAVGVDQDGAGDQGMMFGFACNETPSYMPLPIVLAHKLAAAIDQAREKQVLSYLRPDGKTQVTVKYEDGHPVGIEKIVLAVPHEENVQLSQVKEDLFSQVVQPTLEQFGHRSKHSQLTVNGTGVWHIGGPVADTGLTGRKIIVDGYGGYARVGGGAFSGKDPTKVDRSGAYAARYIAKHIVAHGLAEKVEVGLAYCIGYAQPVMKTVETYGTEKVSPKKIREFVDQLLDTSVKGIIEKLELRKQRYLPTAAYGHFGDEQFSWERLEG
ncbi:methionine adenosyltransferase [Patescibacteria group bacterium]|nr:methionine adenosyltransferase [Patescibacteria group bacterium]